MKIVPEALSSGFDWTVSPSGLYYGVSPGADVRSIRFLASGAGESVEVLRQERNVWPFLAVSPDDEWILYTRPDPSRNELMLMENFR